MLAPALIIFRFFNNIHRLGFGRSCYGTGGEQTKYNISCMRWGMIEQDTTESG